MTWCVACGKDINDMAQYRRVHWGGIDLMYHEPCYHKLKICQLCSKCNGIIRYGEQYTVVQASHGDPSMFYCGKCKDRINERIHITHEPTEVLRPGHWA